MTEPFELPEPIAAYFRADRTDAEAVAQCFLADAVVKDEGRTINGRPAIAQWKADASAKYRYTSKPIACEQKDGLAVVTSRLTGDFPGSPVTVRYSFRLERGKIRCLVIAP